MSVYFITGATGYIASMIIKHLAENINDSHVIALSRDSKRAEHKFETIIREVESGQPNVERIFPRLGILQVDLCDSQWSEQLCKEIPEIDYIIHCAAITSSLEMISHPVEVAASIVNATQNVLEFARHYKIKSMVYLSSMEVYGDIESLGDNLVSESEAAIGRVELLHKRSCYPLGKRMAENLCYNYFQEYGIPVKIARLAQTFGRGVLTSDNRIFTQIARSIKSGTDIVLHTEGCSMGNYCAIDDVISGILTIMERGQNGEAYNVVNEKNTMTIREMAEMAVSQVAKGNISVCYDIPEDNRYGYAPDTGLKLSGRKLRSLGWEPKKDLVEMYREIVEDMDNS